MMTHEFSFYFTIFQTVCFDNFQYGEIYCEEIQGPLTITQSAYVLQDQDFDERKINSSQNLNSKRNGHQC